MVISSGSNKLIPVLLFLSGIKKRYGYASGKLSECLYTRAIKLERNQYAANMYHDLLDDLTLIDKVALPKIDVDTTNVEKFNNSVLIHPGVSKISVQKLLGLKNGLNLSKNYYQWVKLYTWQAALMMMKL